MDMIAKPEALQDIKIIDADTHIVEVPDLWTSRASAKYKDRVPQIKDVDGDLTWVIDGDTVMGPAFPVTAIKRDGSKIHGVEIMNIEFEDAFAGSYDAKARAAYMDSVGIAAQIAYPNLLGFGNQKSLGVDPELRYITTQIYNDAMAEFQKDSGDRIFPQALIPWWNVEQSVAETKRCHKMGLRGINTNPEPENHKLPCIKETHWDPLWNLCMDLDMPVNFHIGAGFEKSNWFGAGSWTSKDANTWMAFGSSMLFFCNYKVFVNVLLSGWLERFPKLKIVSVESGVGWIPFMMEALEYFIREENIKLKTPIREVFARQIYGCSWFERRNVVYMARDIGIDNVLFQTDFPHPVCLYPDPMNYMADAAAAFTLEERRKVYGGNAAKVYNIDLSKIAA
jgi:predicted TIM-barrel fold metal-dependent hydrolase